MTTAGFLLMRSLLESSLCAFVLRKLPHAVELDGQQLGNTHFASRMDQGLPAPSNKAVTGLSNHLSDTDLSTFLTAQKSQSLWPTQ